MDLRKVTLTQDKHILEALILSFSDQQLMIAPAMLLSAMYPKN